MKNTKKMLAVLFVLTLLMSLASATAQDSPDVTGIVTEIIESSSDNDDACLKIRNITEQFQSVVDEVKETAKLKSIMGDKYEDGMQVVDAKEIYIVGNPEKIEFNSDVVFTAPSFKGTFKTFILYLDVTIVEVASAGPDAMLGKTFGAGMIKAQPAAYAIEVGTLDPNTEWEVFPATAGDGTIAAEVPHTGLAVFVAKNTEADKPSDPEDPPKNPQTGDTTPLTTYGVIAIIAAVLVASAVAVKKYAKR